MTSLNQENESALWWWVKQYILKGVNLCNLFGKNPPKITVQFFSFSSRFPSEHSLSIRVRFFGHVERHHLGHRRVHRRRQERVRLGPVLGPTHSQSEKRDRARVWTLVIPTSSGDESATNCSQGCWGRAASQARICQATCGLSWKAWRI